MRRIATIVWQHGALMLLIVALAVSPACGKFATEVEKFAPVVTNVLTLACAFSPAAPLCFTGAAAVNALIPKLVAAVGDYQTRQKAGTATLAAYNDLNALLGAFEGQAQAIFSLLHLTAAGTQQEALAVEAAAKALLAVIEAQFPGPPLARATRRARANFDLGAWEQDYNRKVDAARRANPGVRLKHVHSALATRLTAGLVK